MSALDDLEIKVKSLRDKLKGAEKSWHEAMIAAHPCQPGTIGIHRGTEVKVCRLVVRYDIVRLYGNKKTKNGWHATETELWQAFNPKDQSPAPPAHPGRGEE